MLIAIRNGNGQGVHNCATQEDVAALLKQYPNCSHRRFDDSKYDAAVNWANITKKQKNKKESHPLLDMFDEFIRNGYYFAKIKTSNNTEHIIALTDIDLLIAELPVINPHKNGDMNAYMIYGPENEFIKTDPFEFKNACESWDESTMKQEEFLEHIMREITKKNKHKTYQHIPKTTITMYGDFAVFDKPLSELLHNERNVELRPLAYTCQKYFQDIRLENPIGIHTNQITDIQFYRLPFERNITDSIYMHIIHKIEQEQNTSFAYDGCKKTPRLSHNTLS